MSAIDIERSWTTYVGRSHGMRQRLRRAIASRYGVPACRIEFRECADADADNEIARHSLRGRYGQVLTHLDLDEIDPWS